MRTSPSIHELCLVVAESDRAAANEVAVEVFKGEANRATFDRVPLSSDGTEPASHWWARLRCTESERQTLLTALGAGRVPSVRFWRFGTDRKLSSTNVSASGGRVGKAISEADMLNDAGLMRVTHEMETN